MSERSPYPGIPEPGEDLRSLSMTVRALKEVVEMLAGHRGAGAYKALSESDADQIRTKAQTTALQVEGVLGQYELQATAIDSIKTTIGYDDSGPVAEAVKITELDARVDDVDAAGYFKIATTATPTASSATVEAQVKAGTGGDYRSAGMRLIADGASGRVEFDVDRFKIYKAGTNVVPFEVIGDTVYINNVIVRTGQIAQNAVSSHVVYWEETNSPDPTDTNAYSIVQSGPIQRTLGTKLLIQAQWQATRETGVSEGNRTRPFRIRRKLPGASSFTTIHSRELSIPVVDKVDGEFVVHGLMGASFIDESTDVSGSVEYSVEFKHVNKEKQVLINGVLTTISVSQPVNQRFVSYSEFKR